MQNAVSDQPLAELIRDMYLERVSLLMRHEDVAQVITDYDINNAYQYIIAREETHLSWLQHALLDLGAKLVGDPSRGPALSAKGDAWKSLAADDARANGQFVDKWRPKVETVTQRAPQGHAEGDPRRDARAQAALRAGRERPAGSDRQVARDQRSSRRRDGHPLDR